MIIDFYHVDAFEAANYEPIWKKLISMGVDARMVAATGNQNTASANWFDFDRFHSYCTERAIPYQTSASENAALGVTTQNADILKQYTRRVRLMYGPVVYPFAWALQPHAVMPFDAVLTHGPFYHQRFSNWLSADRLPMTGYPRYDRFFSNQITKNDVLKKWGIQTQKPILAFLPTWGENTAFDIFFSALTKLSAEFEIVLRPHHCTLRFEPNRMNLMKQSGFLILDNAFDLDEVYAAADVVISDVRSGSLFESCLCDVPTVGLVMDEVDLTGWIPFYKVDSMVSICDKPAMLKKAIDQALENKGQKNARYSFSETHVSHRDGSAAEQTALALIEFGNNVHKL